VQFVAIVEQRLMHRHVYIPALGVGGPVPELDDVHASAVALAAAATGLPAADLEVSLCTAVPRDTVLPASPSDVEVRHRDGIWHTAQHTGWLRQWGGSWWPLVSYAAEGAMWTRAVRASCVRQFDADVPAIPAPRVGVEPERLALLVGDERGSPRRVGHVSGSA
jgi:hypothetical protein